MDNLEIVKITDTSEPNSFIKKAICGPGQCGPVDDLVPDDEYFDSKNDCSDSKSKGERLSS